MSEIVGEAVLRIRTDDTGVERGITASGKKAGEGFASGFKGSLKGLAGAAGLAIGVDKAVDFLKGGIDAATSFQDEMGALNVIVGKEGTAAIAKFGDTSADAFGISRVAALEAAHTFSTFGKSAGLSGGELAKFSTDFTGLAGDLASFNGGSTEDAITAIGSALRGEAEPIRRYGVLLDEATLRQAALRLGIIKNVKDALTPQQKVLAAQAEIFRQTKDAQGDSARTADSAANSQKRLTAQLADLRLEVGEKLLPVATDITKQLSEFVSGMEDGTGAGGKFVDVLHETADVGKTVLGIVTGLPGPVKKFGLEALAAYLILRKLGPSVGSLGDSATGAVGRLRNLSTELQTSEGRMEKLRVGSRALGSGITNLAGVGGMLLLTDSSQRAAGGLTTLESAAGGALSGAALGAFAGPVGAAIGASIGGIGGAVLGLTREMNDNTAAAKDAVPAIESYASSLRGVGAAASKDTRKIAISNLAANKKFFEGTGLGERVIVNAILGRGRALETVTQTLTRQREVLVSQRDATEAQLAASTKYFNTQKETATWTTKQREDAFDQVQSDQKLVDAAKERLRVVDAQRAGQDKLIGSVQQEQNEQRHLNALALSYKDLLAMGIAPAVARAFDSKRGVGPFAADVANLIDQFHIIDETKWAPIIRAAGLQPSKAVLEQIRGLLKDIERTRRPKIDKSSIEAARAASVALYNSLGSLENRIHGIQRFDGGLDGNPATPRAGGGPVRAGLPYIVGEHRAELFVPDSNGRILPQVPAASAVAATSQAAQQVTRVTPAPVSIVQNYYGPTTGRGRLSELEWTLRYATRARQPEGTDF